MSAEITTPRQMVGQAVASNMLEPAARAEHTLKFLGRSEQPPNGFPWRAETGRWWQFFEHDEDPTALLHGGVVVPEKVQTQLEELLREGFSPHLVIIGHELETGWEPGDPLPSLIPKAQKQLSVDTPPSHLPTAQQSADVAVRTAGAIGKVAFALGKGAVMLGAAIGSALTQIDPVILAGVRHEDGSVSWVEVCRWTW